MRDGSEGEKGGGGGGGGGGGPPNYVDQASGASFELPKWAASGLLVISRANGDHIAITSDLFRLLK